jgi:hypothetical protein
MRSDNLNRSNLASSDPDRRTRMGGTMMAVLAGLALLALLFMWSPWSSDNPGIASDSTPATTKGSSTARPAAPNTTR